MSYITLSNAMGIINNSDIKEASFTEKIYHIPIYFFNNYEKNSLLAIKELLKNPENYFTEFYQPIERDENNNYVYQGSAPSHHKSFECPRLNSDYKNYEIPSDIIDQGLEVADEFRAWFKSVAYLLERDPDAFVTRLYARWGILTNVKAIEIRNSGSTKMDDRSIEEIKEDIDKLIKKAGRFYYASTKNKKILSAFSRLTFLAYKDEQIYNNETGYSDSEVKALLKYYDEKFKQPLKDTLILYYRLDLNPDIEMKGQYLERLGFHSCNHCN